MKQHLRSICMVLAFLIGGIFYDELSLLDGWLPYGIGLMLTISFMGINPAQLKPRRLHLVVLLVLQLLAMAFWGLGLCIGDSALAQSLFFCAAAPVATASPVIVSLLRGNVAFMVTAMVLSQAVFTVVMPFVLPFVVQDESLTYSELAWLVAEQLMSVMLLPALLAIILRKVYPHCRTWPAKLKDFSLGLWNVNLTIVAAAGVKRLVEGQYSLSLMWPLALGAVAVCATGFLLGYRLGAPNFKRECSQALGQKNTIMTLYIAGQSYVSPLAYIGLVCYVFCHNIANAIQLAMANRQNVDK